MPLFAPVTRKVANVSSDSINSLIRKASQNATIQLLRNEIPTIYRNLQI